MTIKTVTINAIVRARVMAFPLLFGPLSGFVSLEVGLLGVLDAEL